MQIVELSADHPGFHDPVYRRRRDEIAALSESFQSGDRPPRVAYTPSEESTWSAAWSRLLPLHRELACSPLQEAQEELGLWKQGVPQLDDLSAPLRATGFSMEPVAGLVESRAFFRALENGVFLATQYVRHASRPFYTPEPDVIHELVGHAASLTLPEIAHLSRLFGQAVRGSSNERLQEIERVYWYTLEFGAVLEGEAPRALGAGLLSSVDELAAMPEMVCRRWSPEELSATPYDPTAPQPSIFAAPSLEVMTREITDWLTRPSRRSGAAFRPQL